MRKVTVLRMRERYAQTVLTFRITYVHSIGTTTYMLWIVIHSNCHSLQILWELGITQCIVHSLYGSVSWRPENDSVRVETCSPTVTLYILYLALLCLTDIFYTLYSINTSGWKTSNSSLMLDTSVRLIPENTASCDRHCVTLYSAQNIIEQEPTIPH